MNTEGMHTQSCGPRNLVMFPLARRCDKTGTLLPGPGTLRYTAGTVYGHDLGTFCGILFLTEYKNSSSKKFENILNIVPQISKTIT